MKILIAGLGSIGRRHFRNLLALGERDILLYRTQRSSLPDDELAGFPVETDLQAALAHKPQAVIICNPTALHLEVAIPVAEAGCSILLEKPVSHTLEGMERLELALQRGGGNMLVGFQFRFHPTLCKAAELIRAGRLGKPLSVHAHWGEYLPDWHPWEDFRKGYSARTDLGGGVVLTLSHPLDYLRFLIGEVGSVWAFTSSQGFGLPVEDTAEIGLRFSSGVVGSLHLDYNQRPPAHYFEITGTQGSLRWDNSDGSLDVNDADTQTRKKIMPPTGFERNQLFMDEMSHFLSVLRGESDPLCTWQDGKQALRLALAALQSAEQARMVELENV
jgi:predicted dehydrogenase